MRKTAVAAWILAWVGVPLLFLRCNSAGSSGNLDTSFSSDGKVTVDFNSGTHDEAFAALELPSGKIAVVGRTYNGTDYDFAIALLTSSGELDSTFSADGKLAVDFGGDDSAYSLALMANGSLAIGGSNAPSSGTSYFAVAAVKTDGTMDTSFSGDGRQITPIGSSEDVIRSLGITSDGKIVAAGTSKGVTTHDAALARYTTAGALDTDFSTDGKLTQAIGTADDLVYSLFIQDSGKYVIGGSAAVGSDTDWAMARFTTAGVLDNTFGSSGKLLRAITSNGDESIHSLVSDGGENFYVVGTTSHQAALARYTSNGTIDVTFGTGGDGIALSSFGTDITPQAAAADSFYNLYAAGSTSTADFGIAKYSSTGNLQTIFGDFGLLTTNFFSEQDDAYGVTVQSDGKPIVVGRAQSSGQFDFAIARYEE